MPTSTLAYDGDFICRHCGAQYLVRYTELPIADSGSVDCEDCRRQMIQWNSELCGSTPRRLPKQFMIWCLRLNITNLTTF
jgi:hypothetical protein